MSIPRIINIFLMATLALMAGCRPAPEDNPRRTPVVEAVERAMPSVVNIGTERMVKTVYDDPVQRFRGSLREKYFSEYFGPPPPPSYKMAHSLGSGIVIHSAGYILTNYHVIEKASLIYVTLPDGGNYQARLVAGDPVSDLGLLKIAAEEPLQTIQFAADDDLLLGEKVIVLGNPYGLSQSVTVGVLSSKNREARYNGEVLFQDILQTDAAVNPGNSGGPMLNIHGELIGVNIAIYRDAQNIGFAVPVKRVRRLLEHWLSPEFLMKKTFGLQVEAVPDEQGLKVIAVDPESEAARSGLEAGELITAVDGKHVETLLEYEKALIDGGTTQSSVRIEVANGVFGGREHVLDWRELPKPSGALLAKERLGLEFKQAEKGSRQAYAKGLLISDVLPDSPAENKGLYEGLYLTAVNGNAVQNLDGLGNLLKDVKAGDKVRLTLVNLIEQGPFRIAQQVGVELVAD